MEVFYAAKKRADDAGDAEALAWFLKVEQRGRVGYFHIVNGKNNGDRTALHEAVDDKALEAAQRLLEVNADVNAVGSHRWTPLHVAAYCGHADLIEMLLEAKADPCARDKDGETPVDWAKGRHGANRCLWFREVGLARLVQMEGGRSRSDAQVVC